MTDTLVSLSLLFVSEVKHVQPLMMMKMTMMVVIIRQSVSAAALKQSEMKLFPRR